MSTHAVILYGLKSLTTQSKRDDGQTAMNTTVRFADLAGVWRNCVRMHESWWKVSAMGLPWSRKKHVTQLPWAAQGALLLRA